MSVFNPISLHKKGLNSSTIVAIKKLLSYCCRLFDWRLIFFYLRIRVFIVQKRQQPLENGLNSYFEDMAPDNLWLDIIYQELSTKQSSFRRVFFCKSLDFDRCFRVLKVQKSPKKVCYPWKKIYNQNQTPRKPRIRILSSSSQLILSFSWKTFGYLCSLRWSFISLKIPREI